MTAPLLEIEGLTAGYGGVVAIRGLNLTVSTGEVVALLGPNGAGKTTTLRVISGLNRPMSGAVRFEGKDIVERSPQSISRGGIVQVPEGRGVFFGLTVAEHFRVVPGKKLDLEEAFGYFPALEPLANRRVGLLSGGEQQMVALALALCRRPRILLLDELSLGLAPVIVEKLLPVVRRYCTESGAGALVVEQHVHLGLEIADYACILAHGEEIESRPAAELRGDHQLLLASYLGPAGEVTAPDNTLPDGRIDNAKT